ncbi:MAG: hypothetical protein HMLKMBBP_01222 [Planctomycetes bacterium]|nr:hypothetical protein [Planctomycetota bacterium]
MGGSADRLAGNRSWRVETPSGPVLQKLYVERAGPVRTFLRELLLSAAGSKTSARAAARCATERRLLAAWRAAGADVPRDLTDAPEGRALAGPRIAVFEFIDGATSLWDLVVDRAVPAEARRAALARFAAAWGARHAAALRANDPSLVQEHGSIRHVLLTPDRVVTIDLEQAFRGTGDVLPLVAKEIAGYLRSLRKRVGEERFPADLATMVAAYPDPALLVRAADCYLAPRGIARIVWWADRVASSARSREEKFGTLARLRDAAQASSRNK